MVVVVCHMDFVADAEDDLHTLIIRGNRFSNPYIIVCGYFAQLNYFVGPGY